MSKLSQKGGVSAGAAGTFLVLVLIGAGVGGYYALKPKDKK